ncbi:MAG TPA: amino acid ABC transporter substrate-binding protein [Alphaproteobacteria bacterium]
MSIVKPAAVIGPILIGTVLGLTLPATAQELDGTLKKIKESGTITLGHRESSIPFSYYDDNQHVIGFAMDICAKVVEAIKTELKLDKLEVKLNPVIPSTRIPLIANGTVDLECGSTTNNPDRQKQVAFTNTHFLTATRFVSKTANKLVKIDDLKGKTVVSTAGSSNIVQLNDVNTARKLGINILAAKDHGDAFLMVETDRAVAFVMDDILLASFVAGSKTPDAYVISDETFSLPEPYGIVLRRNDAAFKAVVDRATALLYQSPEIVTIYDRWFMSPIPPKGLNLHLPLDGALKNAFAHPTDNGDPTAY